VAASFISRSRQTQDDRKPPLPTCFTQIREEPFF